MYTENKQENIYAYLKSINSYITNYILIAFFITSLKISFKTGLAVRLNLPSGCIIP